MNSLLWVMLPIFAATTVAYRFSTTTDDIDEAIIRSANNDQPSNLGVVMSKLFK